ncbi:bacteriocin precursor peptide PlnE [Lactiplantibacillus plantarum]|uniref:PlnE n=1 Tax=Lactiplantibacillus plantarum TaxID=1590 RepID=D5KLX1_LACPN|nr:PlnE [Lactiplantibacillus plantarum]AGO07045.1 bacteriocin precursor peptide PlnE [Lactiplantibacillus plantarum 16]EMP42925.1 bacteriocin precursor peptide PlnE [Lactiplantibacillus plantarum UCMA 3037]APB86135.1 bacteriocin precursor peptide PlnE [Lactiplantibacillus plantarum]KZD95533.1 putative bacteriocin precursor peptide PlnE [Lactiplantibacillus plantarum]
MLQFEKLQYSRLPQKSLPKYLVVLIGAVITLVKVFDIDEIGSVAGIRGILKSIR